VLRQEMWSYSTWFGKCSSHSAYSASTLWSSQVCHYFSY